MTLSSLFKSAAIVLLAVVMLGLGLVLGLLAPSGGHADQDAPDPGLGDGPTMWTCSMHPQIQQPKPGLCPICAMDLIPLPDGDRSGERPRLLVMSEAARALARIRTEPVSRRFVEAEVRLVGKVDFDETRTRTMAARFPARIDRLYVDYTGIAVREGDHLARVYSPELLTAQQELLSAIKYGSNVETARGKLRLWDLSDERIRSIEERQRPSDRMDIDALLGGIVIEKHVNEGDYVQTGQPLFTIADLSGVWIKLEAYESDMPWLRYGQPATFRVEAVPGRQFEGTVSFLSPTLNPETRTVHVRVNADNSHRLLKPDMFVHATIRATLAAGGKVVSSQLAGKWISPMHPEIIRDEPGACPICGMALVTAEELGYSVADEHSDQPPLVVPASAVLRTGRRSIVYVEVEGSNQPAYEGREILIGPRAGDFYIVEEGLMEGERVVAQGNFKIDSALQIVAKPSMMNPEGGGEAGGHDHGKSPVAYAHADSDHGAAPFYNVGEGFREQLGALLIAYLRLQSALASDNLADARAALPALTEALETVDMSLLEGEAHESWMREQEAVTEAIQSLMAASDLPAMRVAFEALSDAVTSAAQSYRPLGVDAVYQVHCPMAFDDKGASWLQAGAEVRNPYFGAEMLECGVVKRELIKEAGKSAQPGHEH